MNFRIAKTTSEIFVLKIGHTGSGRVENPALNKTLSRAEAA